MKHFNENNRINPHQHTGCGDPFLCDGLNQLQLVVVTLMCSLVGKPCLCFIWSLLAQNVHLLPPQTVSFMRGWADKTIQVCKANVQALGTVYVYYISGQSIQSGPCHWTAQTSFWICKVVFCLSHKHTHAHLGYIYIRNVSNIGIVVCVTQTLLQSLSIRPML